ncbi:GMP synthase (glutamine-hydrolyzing) [Savitreella phatthalungensis]
MASSTTAGDIPAAGNVGSGGQADAPAAAFDTILILDFGSQYTHLITRRLRDLNIYSEMLPCTASLAEIRALHPKGLIFSGGPYSVYEDGAPHVSKEVFELGLPILGICYGLQELAWHNGRGVAAGTHREYGHATLSLRHDKARPRLTALFDGLGDDLTVWMSHGDKLSGLPAGFEVVASTTNAPYAAIAHTTSPIYGIQFHPEVTHTPHGTKLIQNFAITVCGCNPSWNMTTFAQLEVERIRELVGPTGQVIGAVSGGVDSTVAAKLMQEAIGDRFHAVLVDNGLLRLDEAVQVKKTLQGDLGINLRVEDASAEFLGLLEGVSDPEQKRKIIGNQFIRVFERVAKEIDASSGGQIDYLLQGTLYPDVIESISFKGPSQTIKTHHNVGGLLKDMKLKLIEPLRELFKDEVRAMGRELGISAELVGRHPFPGPGIAIRILGPITADQCRIARAADKIFIDEIRAAGLYDKIAQAYAALLPVRAVGVAGDKRTYEQVIALRAVETSDFMTCDWFDFEAKFLRKVSSRILNEVAGVNRCVYDISQKPPATIEWE